MDEVSHDVQESALRADRAFWRHVNANTFGGIHKGETE
jgi:hypothetical protein